MFYIMIIGLIIIFFVVFLFCSLIFKRWHCKDAILDAVLIALGAETLVMMVDSVIYFLH